jgi:hypothetical protein
MTENPPDKVTLRRVLLTVKTSASVTASFSQTALQLNIKGIPDYDPTLLRSWGFDSFNGLPTLNFGTVQG